MVAERSIRVSALVIADGAGRILMVRKSGTRAFMLPGGKPEAGESPRDTVLREISEELGLDLGADDVEELGTFSAPAANEGGHTVTGDVFVCRRLPEGVVPQDIAAQAEIEELGWFPVDPLPADDETRTFAPLTRTRVIPALRERAADRAHAAQRPGV